MKQYITTVLTQEEVALILRGLEHLSAWSPNKVEVVDTELLYWRLANLARTYYIAPRA